ncbi:MAG: hypothetical protein CO035_04810, partial [Candidatus Omnitrophica bacterium CG_4_9_14_0_2_um_filter_42_8]
MSTRVHQLAKELGISSKDLMDKLHSLKIDVKGHMSILEDDTASLVKEELKPKKTAKSKTKEKVSAPKKAAAPAKEKAVKKIKEPEAKAKQPKAAEKKTEPKIVPKVEVKAGIEIEEKIVEIEVKEELKPELKVLKIDFPVVIKDLASKLGVKPADLIKKLLDKKVLVTINQALNEDVACSICSDYGYLLETPP